MRKKLLDLSSVSFLIVDDNDHIRRLIAQILRSLGAQVIKQASDGGDALSVLANWDADIIITNWMMTPLDGIELTRTVRTSADSRNPMTPIIMLTAFSEAERVKEARDAGVTEVVVKPVSPSALYRRIEEVILRPRQFVRCETFVGPDRHRHRNEGYDGPRRRSQDTDQEEPATADADS